MYEKLPDQTPQNMDWTPDNWKINRKRRLIPHPFQTILKGCMLIYPS